MPPALRGLKLLDPRKVNDYIKKLLDQIAYHKIMEKIEILEEAIYTNSWNHQHQVLYEKVDKLISESMRCAEKLVARTQTGPYSWSLEVAQSIQAVL